MKEHPPGSSRTAIDTVIGDGTLHIEDNAGAVKMFEAVGFKPMAVLEGRVEDLQGQNGNLSIDGQRRVYPVGIMENWIQDSVVPAFGVPGDGA